MESCQGYCRYNIYRGLKFLIIFQLQDVTCLQNALLRYNQKKVSESVHYARNDARSEELQGSVASSLSLTNN